MFMMSAHCMRPCPVTELCARRVVRPVRPSQRITPPRPATPRIRRCTSLSEGGAGLPEGVATLRHATPEGCGGV